MAHTISTENASVASAEELFASPSPSHGAKETSGTAPSVRAAEPAASRTITADSTHSSASSAHELFSSGEPSSGIVQQPVEATDAKVQKESTDVSSVGITEGIQGNTAEVSSDTPVLVNQSDNPTPAAGGGTAADFFGSNGAANAPATLADEPKDADENVAEASDGMDDVPLEEVPLTPSEGNANGPSQATAAMSSIGLPPPPFSSRQ